MYTIRSGRVSSSTHPLNLLLLLLLLLLALDVAVAAQAPAGMRRLVLGAWGAVRRAEC